MSDCTRIRDELGGYVLEGLEPDEVAAVDRHLATCAACRTEAERLGRLPDLLALAWSAPPPAPRDLRDRVLRTRRPRRRVPALVAAALVSVAALLGLAVGVTVGWGEGTPDPDTVVVLEQGVPLIEAGEAALTEERTGVRIDLDVEGVRPAGEGYYHVWLARDVDGEQRVSAGTFVGTQDGEVRVQLSCGGRLDDYHRLLVTWHGADGAEEVVATDVAFSAPPADGDLDPSW